MSTINLAQSEEEIQSCYSVMVQLRPHLNERIFVDQVLEQMAQGYRLVALEMEQKVMAVAGYRISTNLAWGRFLYVDDLVTDEQHRSLGLGKQLLDWLKIEAEKQACQQLHLDSGLQRKSAHSFYKRENTNISGYHFACVLNEKS